MKTSVMEVHDMLSVLSVLGVEKRIGEVPGVESVTVNFAAGSATVRYDETRLNVADIKSAVRQNAYQSEGESTPGHVSKHAEAQTSEAAPASARLSFRRRATSQSGGERGTVNARSHCAKICTGYARRCTGTRRSRRRRPPRPRGSHIANCSTRACCS
jgi:copper chaperone CopZ